MEDQLQQQIVNIVKAGAYDSLFENYKQLQRDNEILKIELKAANAMLKAYEQFVNDTKPKDALTVVLPTNDVPESLFQSQGIAFPDKSNDF